MARTNPFEFLQQVRTEVAKVTWPTRRETVITTVMVLLMSVAAALFFLAADWILSTSGHVGLGSGPLGGQILRPMAKRWYIVHAYSNFERKVAESIKERAASAGLADMFEEVLVPMEEVVEMRRGRKVSSERKFFPGYVLVKMELNDQTYHLIKSTPEGHGLSRHREQAHSDHRRGGRAHPAAGAGRRGAAEALGHLRDRRAGARRRRAVRLVQRPRRGSRRGAGAAQGGGVDFRQGDAGRTRICASREAVSDKREGAGRV